MTEYDELIAALRFCDGGECDGCCEYKKEHGCNTLLRDAADVIEALSMKLLGDEAAIAGMKREIERMIVTGADKPKWIPVRSRPMDEEEQKEWSERLAWELEPSEAIIYTSQLPDDGQEVLVCNKRGIIWMDAFYNDPDYGCGFEDNGDMDGIVAWMPLPKPYKEEPHGA